MVCRPLTYQKEIGSRMREEIWTVIKGTEQRNTKTQYGTAIPLNSGSNFTNTVFTLTSIRKLVLVSAET